MAVTPDLTNNDSIAREGAGEHVDAPELRLFVMGLFFIFGGITSLNDVIIPKLKELFTLNYTQAMLVQFCFFTAYLLIGIPGAKLVKKIGYMRGAVAGLLTMMVGCLLFIPASRTATYGLFLLALFVLASGVVIVQVVANPLISLLGKPETAHSRLTFAQAFNSLGTTIFPIAGSALILGSLAKVSADQLSGAELDAYRTAESQAIVHGYLGIAVALAVVAGAVWLFRNRLQGEKHEASAGLTGFDLLKRPRFGFGALCIFLYVGAEVSIGSLIVSYLMQPGVMGLQEQAAGKLIGLYWGGAMIGRFIGSAVMRVISPGKLLACVAVGAITLILISIGTTGSVSGYSLLAIGLMNSIMFPTIFSLASERLGPRAADGSGIINVAIFGGAVVPLATGALADLTGHLGFALLLPAACYAIIAAFGVYARRPAPDLADRTA
ncbi:MULTISPECIES: sugar MFS transporter [unclassified Sphingopyxis]|uniref:sugar MFS transporter n=1 Tax=unclassified Sphingopyxis TaxID=2614943 RepID=UPI000731505F|nr:MULTISPECIES: sugar MFS transporter [unclassified Sphingopyxis]KTE24667.1 glucose transporter [Sphingopyxis sp. H057]KTE49627.1 glucose transporter [Sphingopyxis sp. H071]KTE50690.1 glucose transporter [Sphingopyxis sp. H073]KTE57139.1 glucose transporter [Sphingopyxis sp. H107]KTE62141.1 glucose transporter [Sphingopyxis sp. H100]